MKKAQPTPFEAKEVSGDIILYDAIGFQVSFNNAENLKEIARVFQLAECVKELEEECEELQDKLRQSETNEEVLKDEITTHENDAVEIKSLAGEAKTKMHEALQSINTLIQNL